MAQPRSHVPQKGRRSNSRQGLLQAIRRSYPKQGTFTDRLFKLYERKVRRLGPEDVEALLDAIEHVWGKGKMPLVLELRLLSPLLERFFDPTFYYPEEISIEEFENNEEDDRNWGEAWKNWLDAW